MDFRALVGCCAAPCAVVSVEVTEDARRGDIRIACGNRAFQDTMGPSFYDGSSYAEWTVDDSNFADLCVRSAIMGQRVHSYAHDEAQDRWIDLTLFPLVRKSHDVSHCLVFTEISEKPDPDRMASVSMDTAAAAVNASVALLGTDDLKEGVQHVLDDILVRTGGFSARLTLVDDERNEAVNYCDAFVKGFFADADMAEVVIPYETVASWQEMLGKSNELIIEQDSDFNEYEAYNPEWIASLRLYGVNSFIMTALRQGGTTIGYLQLSNFDVDRVLEVKELMELMTFMLGAQISNQLLMERLERMSTMDGLTNVLNRHAMQQRVNTILDDRTGGTFGIVSIDLNGLKFVNDRLGHDAGDKLLIQASEVLKGLFRREDLFRTGGDEFVAIVTDIDRDDFEQRVEQLRSVIEKNDSVSFAVGACWSDGTMDFRTTFIRADELMYADKDAYYDAHPSTHRR